PAALEVLPQLDAPAANGDVFLVKVDQLKQVLTDPEVGPQLLGASKDEVDALFDTFQYVDYFVSGSFTSPSFLDGQEGAPADATFHLDRLAGTAQTVPAKVWFFLSVPKADPAHGHVAPFPVALYGHGYTSARFEGVLGFGGTMAKFGVAVLAIDAYGHGLAIDPLLELAVRTVAAKHQLGAFADAFFTGRARDLDNDGVGDSGGDFWTADTFHTRDVVRQSIVDYMQVIKLLRSFDGKNTMQIGGK